MFREEYKKLRSLNIDVTREDFDKRGLVLKYKVGKLFDDYDRQEVTAAPMDGIVECSCKYFEFAGVLCSHALLALRCLHIETIPDKNILKRFTKDGKVGTAEEPRFLMKKNKSYLPAPQHFHRIWMLASTATGNSDIRESVPYNSMHENCADVPLLRHGMNVYTTNAFNMLQDEYEKSRSLVVDAFNETRTREGLIVMFDVRSIGKYSRLCSVTAVPLDGIVTCTCKMFEFAGFLCSHALSVLHWLQIEKIPDRYLLKRFMKDKALDNLKSEAYETMWASFYPLMVKACESEEAYKLVSGHSDILLDRLKTQCPNETLEPCLTASEGDNVTTVNISGVSNATLVKGLKKKKNMHLDSSPIKNINEKESNLRTGQSLEVSTPNGVPSDPCQPPCHTPQQPSGDFLKSPQ